MRRLKTPQELIEEGYQAEGAIAFLHDFLEEEKEKQLNFLMTCPSDEMRERRAVFKYIKGLEPILKAKVQVGIEKATEQFQNMETRQED